MRQRWLADIITFESPAEAERAARKLINIMKRGRKGRLRIGPRRAKMILDALTHAANRAKASTKNPRLKPATRRRLASIARIYQRAAKEAEEIYWRKYKK